MPVCFKAILTRFFTYSDPTILRLYPSSLKARHLIRLIHSILIRNGSARAKSVGLALFILVLLLSHAVMAKNAIRPAHAAPASADWQVEHNRAVKLARADKYGEALSILQRLYAYHRDDL